MWLLKWMPLFVLGALLESTTHIFLKKGAVEHNEVSGIHYYLRLMRNKWVIAGILVYVLEMATWIVLLSHIPLSIAFPLTGFQKIFIVMFSFFYLKEKIKKVEWLGIGITVAGIVVIST